MSESNENVITVKNICKEFVLPHEKTTSVKSHFTKLLTRKDQSEKQIALKNISFEIKKGEFFGIVGRNGSGKSTLLKILANIYQPSSGSIDVKGRLVPFIELGVGFNPELTGRENVFLNGALLGFSKKEIDAMYDEIVEFAELERFMDQKLKNYSSGMQVRLAFSMATRAKAEILLIDEVLAVGDASFQRKCFEYFSKLKKSDTTIVFVTHDMDSVRRFCDRAVMIEDSKTVLIGDVNKVADEYTKLFVSQSVEKPEDSRRITNNTVKMKSLYCNPNHATHETNYIAFGGSINFKKRLEAPVIGFKLANEQGEYITGANSAALGQRLNIYETGDRIDFTWSIPNIFSTGYYTISLAVTSESDEMLESWDDALRFRVTKNHKTPYITAPKIKLKVSK